MMISLGMTDDDGESVVGYLKPYGNRYAVQLTSPSDLSAEAAMSLFHDLLARINFDAEQIGSIGLHSIDDVDPE